MPLLAGLTTFGVAALLYIYGVENGIITGESQGLVLGLLIGAGVLTSILVSWRKK